MGHYQKSLGTTSSGLQSELGNGINRQLFSLQMEEVKMMKFCSILTYITLHIMEIYGMLVLILIKIERLEISIHKSPDEVLYVVILEQAMIYF